MAKETEIWDNDDSEPESDGKIGASGVVEEGKSIVEEEGQPLTAENVQAKQSQFANAWDDDIKLDDGEGSDIGSELTEEMNQNIEVKVKKKKKVKLDSFEKFKRDRRRAVRARNLKRMKALKEGRINETIDDADFKDLSRHRGAVIQMALGSGKHTIKRMTIRKRETVGERGAKAPLPKYVAKEIRQLGGTIQGGGFNQEKQAVEEEIQPEEIKKSETKAKESSSDSDDYDDYEDDEDVEEENVDAALNERGLTQEEEEQRLQRKRERAKARRKKRKANRKKKRMENHLSEKCLNEYGRI